MPFSSHQAGDLKCFGLIQLTIEKDSTAKKVLIVAAITSIIALSACGKSAEETDTSAVVIPTVQPASVNYTVDKGSDITFSTVPQKTKNTSLWTEEELNAIALTLSGECYDDKLKDKRLVCEVILNRVSADGFGDTVIDVLTAPGQFNGYWRQSREISDSDYAIAEQALKDWYKGGCKALSSYLFFSAGANRENVFRSEY